MAKSDGSIVLKTIVDNAGLELGIKTIKSGVAKAGKALKTVAVASTAAAVAITKMAVSAYADYEQLIGGVETLFKGSADKVLAYAQDAFFTAGMSANEYMETVTSFAASLLQSVAGDAELAADIANRAITDMSDNANKMGTDMAMIQNAYQGFAKQNYTMLDNLKLGYGGTKTEMERLLKDAQAITGVKYDISNLADVYTAIGIIQDRLGITGTTAKEAASTVAGSAKMMKAAWKNALVAISRGGDIDKAINNLVYSIQRYFENIVPVVERALSGIGALIEKVAPQLVETIARAFIKALPQLLNAIYQMIQGLIKGLRDGLKSLASGGAVKVAEKQTSAVKQTAKAQDKLNESIKETEKAQKGALAGFDELNNIAIDTAEETEGASLLPASGGGAAPSEDAGVVSTVDKTFAAVMEKVGEGMIAIGAILLCFGHIGMGLKLLIGGGLVTAGAASAKGEDPVKKVKNTLSKVLAIVGPAMLALGVILVCAGIVTGTTIGMILAGAASTVAAVALNWNGIVEALQGPFGAIMALVGASLLVIGVLLVFTMAALPLGLGLIAAGGISLGNAVAANWGAITTKVKEICNAIGSIFKNMWNGIIDAAESAWNAILGVFKTGGKVFVAIKDGIISVFKKVINGLIEGINTVIGLPFKGLNKILDKIEGISIMGLHPFGWLDWRAPVPKIPKGSVIPPNKEFMAVLGDNTQEHEIVSPLSTMKQAFLEALTAANISGNNNQPIILQIDGREIARAVRTANGQMGNQTVYGGFANAY